MGRVFSNSGSMFINGSSSFIQKDAAFPSFTPPLSQAAFAALDTATNRLFMTGASKIWVFNATTLALITSISGFTLLTGIALDITSNNRFFVNDFGAGTNGLYVIDATSYTVTSTVATGSSTQGLAFDDDNQRLLVCNFAGSLTVIDTTTMSMIGGMHAYPLSGVTQLTGIALDKTNNLYWCTSQNQSKVWQVDRTAYTLSTTNTVTGFSSVQDIALDLTNNRFFLSDFNTNLVSILDSSTFSVNATISGFSAPTGLCLDSSHNRVFVLNYNTGVVTIIN